MLFRSPPHPAFTRSYSTADEDRRLAAIFERTFGVTKDRRIKASHIAGTAEHEKSSERLYRGRENPERENFIIIDGYNLIFAWEELKQLSDPDFGVARAKLLDILANYRAYVDCYMLVVFDAYKVKGGKGSVEKIHGIDVVYTKEAQTADAYIEKVTYEISRRYMVRVVTSDSMEQLIILGNGALRVSSRAFIEEIRAVEKEIHSFLNE